jgi:hypothetical protein
MKAIEILRKMNEGVDPLRISDEEGISSEEMKAILSQLEGVGYLKRVSLCDEGCDGCERKSTCGGGGIIFYSITEKGRRSLDQR